jgi:hypothetical protein
VGFKDEVDLIVLVVPLFADTSGVHMAFILTKVYDVILRKLLPAKTPERRIE